jgi:hypothetical protein
MTRTVEQPQQQQEVSSSSSPNEVNTSIPCPSSLPETSLTSSSRSSWQLAIASEALYQLSQFTADFCAFDIAQAGLW